MASHMHGAVELPLVCIQSVTKHWYLHRLYMEHIVR